MNTNSIIKKIRLTGTYRAVCALSIALVLSVLQIPGSDVAAQVLLSEDFSSADGTVSPEGWTNTSAGTTTLLWAFNNPGARTVTGGAPGFSGNFAMFDSDYYGVGETGDASLTTPEFNAAGDGVLILSFDNQVRHVGTQAAYVDVWDGAEWVNVYTRTTSHGYPSPATHTMLDITEAADGHTAAKVRFRFTGTYTWWWAIDNVKIARAGCMNVSDVAVGSITSSSASVSWSGTGSVVIEYGPEGFEPGTAGTAGEGTVATPTASPFVIEGLDPEEDYDIYVRKVCGGGAYSDNIYLNIMTEPLPPANDNCAGAIDIPVNEAMECVEYISATTRSATSSSTEVTPTCGASGIDDDVWFSFTATANVHRISINNRTAVIGSSLDMATAVYSGSCGSLTQLVCSDPESFLVYGLTPGETYYVRVWTWGTTSRVTFDICIETLPPPPANDNCAGAITVPVNAGLECDLFVSATTFMATSTAGETAPTCGASGTDDDVWFTFTATAAEHVISINNRTAVSGSSTDMAIAVYSGGCGSLTQLVCSDPETFLVDELVPGNTYYIRVWTWFTTSMADFDICIGTFPPPPVNDNCGGAIALTVNADYSCGAVTSATTMGATPTGSETAPTCGASGTDDDVWFTFTATHTEHRISIINIVPVFGTSTDMATAVYSGSCGSLVHMRCSDPETFSMTGLTPGETYYVRVWTWYTSSRVNFDICIGSPPPPPVNDDCANAIAFPVIPGDGSCASVTASTYSATSSAGMPACVGSGADDDVWYSFVCPPDHTVLDYIMTTVEGNSDRVIQFFSGTCGSLTSILCSDPEAGSISGLTPGDTYYFRVHTYGTGSATIVNVCLRTKKAGWDCSDPLIAETLPYSHTSNTSEYGDNPDIEGSPGSSCGTTSSYLNGDDVVYKFTSPINGEVDITLTGLTATYAGVFVYESCEDIGEECIAADYNGSSTADLEITEFPVTYGTDYYIVISTWASPQNVGYTLDITVNNCDTPAVVIDGDLEVCIGGSTSVVATSDSEDTEFFWYESLESDVPIATTAAFTTPEITEDVTYYVVAVSHSCTTQKIPVEFAVYETVPVTVSGEEICAGSTATLTASSTVSSSIFNWYETPTSTTIIATGATFVTPEVDENTTFYVQAVTGDCTSERLAVEVTVRIPAEVSAEDADICEGETVTLTATSPVEDVTFRWYSSETAEEPVFVGASYTTPALSASTTYYVTVDIGSCESDREPVGVTVRPLPVFDVSDIIVCYGETGLITPVSEMEGVVYNWYGDAEADDILYTGSAFPTPVLTSPVTYYVEAVLNGCLSERQAVEVSISSPEFTVSDVHICDPASVILEVEAGEGAVVNWYEAGEGGSSVYTGEAYVTPVLSETTTYYVEVTEDGCTSERIAVQVLRTTIDFEINDFAFCPTEDVENVPLSVSTTPAATILWYADEELSELVHTGEEYIAATPDISTTYYVVAQTDDCTSDAREVTITVYPYPSVNVEPLSAIVCAGESAVFTATAMDDQSYSYLWSPEGVEGAVLTTSMYGEHVLTVTSLDYGCVVHHTVMLDTVAAPELEGFDFVPEIFTNPLRYVFTPINAEHATGYMWDFGDGNISEEMNPVHEFAAFGEYIVTLTIYNDCDSLSVSLPIYVQPYTRIENLDVNIVVNVYPNPTDRELNITLSEKHKVSKVMIYNQGGQLVQSESFVPDHHVQLVVDRLAQGAYYVIIETEDEKRAMRPFVVK